MKKQTQFKSAALIVSISFLIFAFNNCAQKLESQTEDQGSAASEQESVVQVRAQAASPQRVVLPSTISRASDMQLAQAPTSSVNISTSKSLVDIFSGLKVYISNSLNGPWVENGSGCKGETTYIRLKGPYDVSQYKTCASPSTSDGCLSMSAHRPFHNDEKRTDEVLVTLSAAESANYPVGQYSFYVSGNSGNTSVIQKVGHATLNSCAGVTPVARTCQFKSISPPVATFGPCTQPEFGCNENNINKKTIINCGEVKPEWLCECK